MARAIGERADSLSARAFRWVLAGGLLVTLAANLPGQMSLDSVVTLQEARTGVRQTWAPAMGSWLVKLFDDRVAGAGLYLTASAALLFVSLMSMARLRGRATWAAVILAALAVATPQVLLYQGIVWRDVVFANLTLAGFILLAHAAKTWSAKPILSLAGALLCLALAALVRQNGLILVVAAAIAVGWTARRDGRRAAWVWGLGSLIAAGALALALNQVAQPDTGSVKLRPGAAALILEHYDVVGAKAHHPQLQMKAIGQADPAARTYLEAEAARHYSAARVDTLDTDDTFRETLWHVPDAAMHAQWRQVILRYPAAYLLHRADVFRWVFLTPQLDRCLPAQVGVEGPAATIEDLDIESGISPQDRALGDYAKRFYGTPIYSHLTWALVAVGMIVLLLRRRDPADKVMVALLMGTLAFVASFAAISVACDYRYLYLLDLAAMASLIYVALDPPVGRRR